MTEIGRVWAAVGVVTAVLALADAAKQPHILLIVADDYGYNDVGYHQNQKSSANPDGHPTTNSAAGLLPTPIIDELAAQGVKLENYYVQPLCSPTRATIMTGRYPSHTGVGPDVIRIDWPYGVPGRETFVSELLKKAGYATHAVGKWHLGACDERYLPNYRGFDSFLGYLSGGQGYYNQAGDRGGSGANTLPTCLGPAFANNYSAVLFADEASRIATAHAGSAAPLFQYLAFQSVHNPYDVPPPEIINVNTTFPEIVDYTRRIYAGMVVMLDRGVGQVVQAYKDAGLWDDTVLIFTADNGGIGVGSNYPLRGAKVLNWEGGVKAVGFVRGTNSAIAPIPPNTVSTQLMHSTDWLPTACRLAGVTPSGTMPLDGFDQWDVLASGAQTKREFIFHNVPVGSKPVPYQVNGKTAYTTSACMSGVDNRTGTCHPFGVTGGAMRKGAFKLLITYPGAAPWEDSSPAGTAQYLPGGRYPNGTTVFTPVTNNTIPEPYNGTYFVFNIEQDPTESNNLAESNPDKLAELLKDYTTYAATAVTDLSWRWGFDHGDPAKTHNPPCVDDGFGGNTCEGPFLGSHYCNYGGEFDCFVLGTTTDSPDVGSQPATTGADCQAKCAAEAGCEWWVLEGGTCKFKGAHGVLSDCTGCVFGPAACPH